MLYNGGSPFKKGFSQYKVQSSYMSIVLNFGDIFIQGEKYYIFFGKNMNF